MINLKEKFKPDLLSAIKKYDDILKTDSPINPKSHWYMIDMVKFYVSCGFTKEEIYQEIDNYFKPGSNE